MSSNHSLRVAFNSLFLWLNWFRLTMTNTHKLCNYIFSWVCNYFGFVFAAQYLFNDTKKRNFSHYKISNGSHVVFHIPTDFFQLFKYIECEVGNHIFIMLEYDLWLITWFTSRNLTQISYFGLQEKIFFKIIYWFYWMPLDIFCTFFLLALWTVATFNRANILNNIKINIFA